jgi:DNA polymerase-3 subunit epsilon
MSEPFKLEKPLAFIDLETTGTDVVKDRIVQIAICKVFKDWSRESKMHYINPGRPIPPRATEVHGIKDEDVVGKPTFKQFAKSLHDYLAGCDIGGFRSNGFDVPMLYYEFFRAGVEWDYKRVHFIDVGNIYTIKEKRTLEAAYMRYCGKPLENAHDAQADIEATVEVLIGQLNAYEDLPRSAKDLAHFSNYEREWLDVQGKFSKDSDGDIIFNFGKHRNEKCKLHPGFLEWMLYTATDFPHDMKMIAQDLLQVNQRH